jgi:hypothetical protein
MTSTWFGRPNSIEPRAAGLLSYLGKRENCRIFFALDIRVKPEHPTFPRLISFLKLQVSDEFRYGFYGT